VIVTFLVGWLAVSVVMSLLWWATAGSTRQTESHRLTGRRHHGRAPDSGGDAAGAEFVTD
jgi:hypothetical protein